MRHGEVIDRVATALGLTVVAPLAGGQFGACRVSDGGAVPLVLKAWPAVAYADRWAQGAAMAERLRALGYPAPRYLGTGATTEACWSLQELLPGDVPTRCTPTQVAGLLTLLARHQNAVGAGAMPGSSIPGATADAVADAVTDAVATLRTRPEAERLADELASLAERSRGLELHVDDVVHADFHTGNVLALGEEITGVFDWEGAHAGDWRSDLANLVVTCDDPQAAGALAQQPAEVAALFVGWHCARYLAFDITDHPPERLTQMLPSVEADLGRWWRATG